MSMSTKRSSSSSRTVRESAVHISHDGDDSTKFSYSPNSSASGSSVLQTRMQEKDELSHLNNRLAGYIEHVRSLQEGNKCLKIRIEEIEISHRKEITETIDQYEKKLDEARDRLNTLTAKFARNEIITAKAIASESEYKSRVYDLEKSLKATDAALQDANKKVQELTARALNAESAQKNLEKLNANFTRERESSQRQITVLQKELEDEVVLRTELENRLQTCKDDLETARRTNVTVNSLTSHVKELKRTLRAQREEFASRLQQRDECIASLEARIASMICEYKDLTDAKTLLDSELQAYRKLLEGEETRLSLDALKQEEKNSSVSHVSSFESSSSSQRRGTKRKHLDENFLDFSYPEKNVKIVSESDSNGDIVIDYVHPEGHFIRLKNNGKEDVPLGGYFLKCTASDKEVTFKFNSRQVFKAGKTISIWSNNVGKEANPPMDVVMKNQQWPTGNAMRIEFLTPQEEIYAFYQFAHEDVYANGDSEKCSIM